MTEVRLVGGPAPARVQGTLGLRSCQTLGPLRQRHHLPAPPGRCVPWRAHTRPHVSFSVAAPVQACVLAHLDVQDPRCRSGPFTTHSPRGF